MPLLPLVAAVLVLAACTTSPAPAGTDGGSIVIGAEQEPDCTDWIATCGASIWGSYMMQTTTIPKAFDVRKVGEDWALMPSSVLTGEPGVVVQNGKQIITYTINPAAVWSDNVPITSADFAYTAAQIRDGDDIFDKTGYDIIESVATPDPKTAVVTLSYTYAPWKQLFGTTYGLLPQHLLEGKDRSSIMKDGYSFSGGPWIIDSWKKGTSITLVPNKNYWGAKPKLARVTFQIITDTAAAFLAMKSGQVQALYPSPQLDAIRQIKAGVPRTNVKVDAQSGNLEALWMNNGAFPFDSGAVRTAVAYSVDRKQIVERLYGALGVTAPVQSFLSPLVSAFAGTYFSRFGRDLDRVNALMTGDGWAKNSNGIWAKGGKAAEISIVSLAGNKRRELTEQVLQSQLKSAGFALTISNTTAAELFSAVAPKGDFQLGLWTLVDSYPEPALGASFLTSSIPTEANGYSGINFMRASLPKLDDLLNIVDTTVDDPAARHKASLEADELIAQNVLSLPLAAVPNILMTSTSVGGNLSINPAEGPFWNLEDWTHD
jgi:peptide/nickel transport system substrate-binding protein